MSFAPHSNTEVRNDVAMTGSVNPDRPLILGEFRNTETLALFEFALRADTADFAFAPGFPHLVFVGNGEVRFAKVLKTVAYIVIDEDANGDPVVEKWAIKGHRDFDTAFVFAA